MPFRNRDELLAKIVYVFSEQPEIREITLFGSNADGTADIYSDIDIRVHSNDLLKTQTNYLPLINGISPILETLLIQSDGENFAQMIMLRDYSPYHKIDFGICSGLSTFTPSKSIFKKDNLKICDSKLQILPIINDVKYNLDYLLFRIPRITKCFFRKNAVGYKKWNETLDIVLGLLFEKYHSYKKISHHNAFSRRRLKNLYGFLDSSDKETINKILPYPGELNLADSFLAALKLAVTISKEKATHFNVDLNEGFISYIEAFCTEECKKINEVEQLRDYWTIPVDKFDPIF